MSGKDGDKGRRGLRVLLAEYMANTSAHGLPNIDRGRNSCRKAVWSLLFMWALGMFIWQCYELVHAYFQWGVDVNIDIQYETQLNFPAVTICNLNPIKSSTIRYSDKLNSLFNPDDVSTATMETTTGTNFAQTINYIPDTSGVQVAAASGSSDPTTPSMDAASTKASRYQDWSNVDFMAKDEELDLFDRFTDVVSQANYEDRVNFGHQIDDMVLSCTFKGYPCTPSNFTYFHNYLYGNCYTFNSGIENNISKSSKSGPLYGLTLELNIEETEYQPSVQEASGIRVLISEQYKMPFPEDAGINVAPGLLTSVGLRKLEQVRKEDPYSTCQQSPRANDTIFSSFFNVGYSLEACQKDCLYRMIQDRCDCDDTRFRFFPDLDPCLSTNASQVSCKETVELEYANEDFDCSCTSPCQEASFEMTVSSAAWPNSLFVDQVRQELMDISDVFKTKVRNDQNFVQNNVLKLQVYYEQLNYEMIVHTPKYNFFGLISNLGGQVGLWIGISMCTVFEVVELLFDIVKLLLLKLMCHAKSATSPSLVDIKLEKKRKRQLHEQDYVDAVYGGNEEARSNSTAWINN
ncbi:amiloride-sensitive sodium channel subunit gamma-like isoform X1 [Asterias rubens]|uniref:amiloride-sensitive sodium channel subunit gamma-like isoform X1 n=1 Tax=Asterias rubens TaxID=7604 RepID=UPI0014551B8E|nr:amiloride-sensitive sodium channel subunit gamma-like isoform X1 [Asterias rubens]